MIGENNTSKLDGDSNAERLQCPSDIAPGDPPISHVPLPYDNIQPAPQVGKMVAHFQALRSAISMAGSNVRSGKSLEEGRDAAPQFNSSWAHYDDSPILRRSVPDRQGPSKPSPYSETTPEFGSRSQSDIVREFLKDVGSPRFPCEEVIGYDVLRTLQDDEFPCSSSPDRDVFASNQAWERELTDDSLDKLGDEEEAKLDGMMSAPVHEKEDDSPDLDWFRRELS